jgi:hypothetical protein
VFSLLQRQVESAQPEEGLLIRIRQSGLDAFLLDLNA